jgi:hypothetical protein
VLRRSCIRMSRPSTWRMSRAYRPLLSSRNLQDGGRCAAVSRLVAEFMALSYTFQKRTSFLWKIPGSSIPKRALCFSRFLFQDPSRSGFQYAILTKIYLSCMSYHYCLFENLWLIWERPGFSVALDWSSQ